MCEVGVRGLLATCGSGVLSPGPLLEDWDIISPREVAAAEPVPERRSLLAAALPFTQALLAQVSAPGTGEAHLGYITLLEAHRELVLLSWASQGPSSATNAVPTGGPDPGAGTGSPGMA